MAYQCPNMIAFDAVDFSECCSEGVLSFFRRSVYTIPQLSTCEDAPDCHHLNVKLIQRCKHSRRRLSECQTQL